MELIFDVIVTRHLIHNVFGIAAIFLNTSLLYLIVRKSPRLLRKGYKTLMVFICFWELIYTILYLYLHPICYAFNFVCFTFITLQNRWLPDEMMWALFSLYFSCFGVFQTTFTAQFMYRYWTMKHKTAFNDFETWKLALWLSFFVLVLIVSALNFYMYLGPTFEKTELIREDMMSHFHLNTSEYTYVSFLYKESSASKPIISQLAQNFVFIQSFVMAVLLLVYSVRCYRAVRSLSKTTSAEYNSMNSQLFYALVTQTATPIVFVSVPAYTVFVFNVMGWNVKVLADIVFLTSCMFPVIDPIPNFLIVKSYREAVLGVVRRAFKRSVEQRSRTFGG